MNEYSTTTSTQFLRQLAVKIAAPLGALASLATVIIMVAVTVDVFSRNLGGRSIPGLLEMSESALVATVFLGIAYTGVTNGHVAVDLVTDKLSISFSRKLAGGVWLISALMVIWFIYASFNRALISTQMGEVSRGLMEWPIWPSRWLIVIGYAAFLIVALINSYLSFRNEPLLGEDLEEEEREDLTTNTKVSTSGIPDSQSTEQRTVAS